MKLHKHYLTKKEALLLNKTYRREICLEQKGQSSAKIAITEFLTSHPEFTSSLNSPTATFPQIEVNSEIAEFLDWMNSLEKKRRKETIIRGAGLIVVISIIYFIFKK
jgi:hypothetical protein